MKKQERVIGSKTLMTLLCSEQQAVQFIIKIYIFLSHMHISYIYLCILNIIIYMQGHHKIYFFWLFWGGLQRVMMKLKICLYSPLNSLLSQCHYFLLYLLIFLQSPEKTGVSYLWVLPREESLIALHGDRATSFYNGCHRMRTILCLGRQRGRDGKWCYSCRRNSESHGKRGLCSNVTFSLSF